MSTNSHYTTLIHILTLLATTQKPQSSSVLAKSINTNAVTVRKMVGILRKAGYVKTIPGSRGGAVLLKEAGQITLSAVYALEKNRLPFGLHARKPSRTCPVGRNLQKTLVDIYSDTGRLMAESLSRFTIGDLAKEMALRENRHNDTE